MNEEIKEIEVNGVAYIPKGEAGNMRDAAFDTEGLPYVVIRSKDSGCHAGFLKNEDKNTITLVGARRLWYWSGAATLSQLAEEGVKAPDDCKFPQPVGEITVYDVCEKIQATRECQRSIAEVPEWKA